MRQNSDYEDAMEHKLQEETKEKQYLNKMKWLKLFSDHRLDLISIGFMVLCFSQVFSSWYYGDDTTTRDLYALMRQENRNLFQYIARQLDYYLIQAGRFFPLHVIQRFLTFYIFNTIEKYRIFIAIMNILAIYSFALMVRNYSGSKKLYYGIMLLFSGTALFLARYDDAVTSYFMFIQTLVIILSFSLICLKRAIEKNKVGFLVFSSFLYLFSLLIYESSYPLVLVYPLAIFYLCRGTLKERLRLSALRSIPYFAIALVCFIIYVSFSMNATQNYQGVNYNFEPVKILSTFGKQTIAALPMVPHFYQLKNPDWNYILNSITVLDATTSIIFICLLSYVFPKHKKEHLSSNSKRFLAWLAVLLIVCPNLLISISTKYQQNLTWGDGYLTVYFSRFGFLLLGCLIYEWLLVQFKTIL